MVYLLRDEKKNSVLYKVGYAGKIAQRMKSYATDNPLVELVEYVETYATTKHQLEKAIHNELRKQGIKFVTDSIFHKEREWFEVEYNSELDIALRSQGLKTFKSIKNHIIYTEI